MTTALPTNQQFWRSPQRGIAESRRAHDSSACYVPHSHPEFSIGAVDAGCSIFHAGNTSRSLGPGDVVLVPGGTVHACNPRPGSAWSYQMLYLDERWLKAVIRETMQSDDIDLCHAANSATCSHAALTALNRQLFSPRCWHDKEAALIRFVGDVFASETSVTAHHVTSLSIRRLAEIKALIAERCMEELPLAELAREAGMSRYHFVRAFRQAFGMTPHAWQLDARVNRARSLIDQGATLAELALSLGFADQSHFQRIFKQRVAVTPGQYQRNFLQDSQT